MLSFAQHLRARGSVSVNNVRFTRRPQPIDATADIGLKATKLKNVYARILEVVMTGQFSTRVDTQMSRPLGQCVFSVI
jgi:hypothetical protein